MWLVGCERDEALDTVEADVEATQMADEPNGGPPTPCTWSRGTAMIDGVRLESDDGACRLYLPSSVSAGRLTVRVSRAGDDTAAAAERDAEDGTLYATTGTVTITESGDGRYVGVVDARDETPPGTGSLSGEFDVTLGIAP
jgi:hypothetical protein